MPLTSSTAPRGLALADLVGTLGGGLLTVAVAAPGPEIDDITLAEPGAGVYGQAGDLLLGVGVESPERAVELLGAAVTAGSGGVVLRRSTARRREVRAAARRVGMTLVELADHASWAHVVWLLRGVLDRAASGSAVRSDGPVHDELFALADACAALVDAPVTIEDTQSRVLAYSSRQDVADPVRVSTIVGRKVPDAVLASLRGRGVFRRLARSNEPFYVPADGALKPRLVIPVRAGNEWLGSIWAVVDGPPDTAVVRSLGQTASVVALHLLRLRSQADLARRVSADRLRTLLSGNLVEAETWLPPAPWRVVVLGLAPDGGAEHPGDTESQVDLWESAARRGAWRQPLVARLDGQVLALVREAPGDLTPGSWDWLRGIVEDVRTTTPGAAVSAGGVVDRAAALAQSRHDALEVQRLREAGRLTGPATTIEDAWAAVTTERAVSGIRLAPLLGPVGDLEAHDREHGSAYAATLAAWLDHPGDPKRAAERLHVHPNTLRYRMQRLGDVVDLDLDDPETRLALRLQLRALGH
ncbi:hypothetical protein N865_05880 [Intrasporangium oryzae NRRL B-24470]|uniref:PucR C-terminal helix-turn-helix domain-containing protein n=1 Tax=Intrasporangium oryzae NRRL B-24470 TaxID=1386089 RepID=W9G4J4_9MICO|nr:helix-turn-helix domain-containing protein [Intrasporangium oryzae]EWT00945.1 hypothetical protein N865_05880 [Intrasporangium oryzae NRRL B-24470]